MAQFTALRAPRPFRARLVTWLLSATVLMAATVFYRTREARAGVPAGFTTRNVAGFTTLLSDALTADPELQERVMWRLEEQLTTALAAVPEVHHTLLRDVRIWIDPEPGADTGFGSGPTAAYFGQDRSGKPGHPFPERAGDIMVVNLPAFIQGHGRYNILLHELAHAYDDRRLQYANPGVLAAFNAARKAQKYDHIYTSTGVAYDSYANTRPTEYFAELTVAYFGSRPDTPRNRSELRAFDPQGYKAVSRAWGADEGNGE